MQKHSLVENMCTIVKGLKTELTSCNEGLTCSFVISYIFTIQIVVNKFFDILNINNIGTHHNLGIVYYMD